MLADGGERGVNMSEFPAGGDNFRLAGPWRIVEGRAWHAWRLAAAEAEARASEWRGEDSAARRLRNRLRRLRAAGPAPVSVGCDGR